MKEIKILGSDGAFSTPGVNHVFACNLLEVNKKRIALFAAILW